MNKNINIKKRGCAWPVLRSIAASDCDALRRWKNANRHAFFYNKVISPEGQAEWFSGYLKDPNNYMFVLEYEGEPVGCIGFKKAGDKADVYNVIMGEDRYRRKGILSDGINMLCSYIKERHASGMFLKVLSANSPARAFYLKNGFVEMCEKDAHVLMELEHFEPVPLEITE